MNTKKITILPILFYSGFASASLYIHQPVEQRPTQDSANLRIVYDDDKKSTTEAKSIASKHQDLVVSKSDARKQDEYRVASKGKESENVTSKSYGKEKERNMVVASKGGKGKETLESSPAVEIPRYKNIVQSSEIPIEPNVKTIYAKMEKGFLSNSMRSHLETLGWELRWSSGADRRITVPFIIEHKEDDVVAFVSRISELYDVFIDVYPANKTIHVSE